MAEAHLSPLEILHALGVSEKLTITSVQGGFDMDMWKVEWKGQTYALRVFRRGEHKTCEQEQIVLAAAHAAGLPVPKVFAAGTWQNRPALLITWLTGRTVADELYARPWRVWRLGIVFGCTQAAIHAVPAPAQLCQQPDAWIAWQCEGDQELQDRLRNLPSNGMALLHLDYHLRNVLTDGKQITGIIDWTNAHAGDPRADAARTISILHVNPLARKPFLQWIGLRIFEFAWRIGYQRTRGRLQVMPLFYAWAGTVIQRDLAHRYEHSPQELAPARRWTNKWKTRAAKLSPESR